MIYNMMRYIKAIVIFSCVLIMGCHNKLPKEKYNQFTFSKSHTYENDSLKIHLKNPLMSPVRIHLESSHDNIQEVFQGLNPIILDQNADTTLYFSISEHFEDDIRYQIFLGSHKKEIQQSKIELPFPKGKTYNIIQGNNTNHTHNTDYSRYAIDFNLSVNDTISSVSDGFVVGVIEDYKYGGKGPEWRSYGNFITVYDSESGVFYQYVHLTHKGSFVAVGDKISAGQPIGLSGETGQTDTPHLHFNSLVPVEGKDKMISIPVEFVEGYKGIELKKNDIVKK